MYQSPVILTDLKDSTKELLQKASAVAKEDPAFLPGNGFSYLITIPKFPLAIHIHKYDYLCPVANRDPYHIFNDPEKKDRWSCQIFRKIDGDNSLLSISDSFIVEDIGVEWMIGMADSMVYSYEDSFLQNTEEIWKAFKTCIGPSIG